MRHAVIILAAVHPANVRLTIAAAGLVRFIAVATTRRRRALPPGAVLLLGLIVVGWLFAATLVWGTGYASKVRWSAAWTHDGNAWQWTALLAVSLAGVASLALSLRSLADARQCRGWVFAAVAGALFAAWSAVVRYPAALAVLVAAAGFGALLVAGTRERPASSRGRARALRQRLTVPVVLVASVIGFVWTFSALAWAVVGREGQPPCGCWADQWGNWQYQTQFFVALGGALSLVGTAVWYVTARHRLLLISSSAAAAAVAGWIAFATTGSL